MKKSLIALAALAATGAFAQSSVQIVGTFDPSLANSSTTYNSDIKVSNSFVRNNSQGTSQITFKGVEDLGGGLKASFLFENDFDTAKDANNGTGSVASFGNFGSKGGEQFLAIAGGMGQLQIGAANTVSLYTQSSSQPFGTKIGGGFGAANTGRVRIGNSVVYTSPVFAGVKVMATYANQTLAAKDDTAAGTILQGTVATGASTDIGLLYANGPLAAGVSAWTTAANAVTSAPSATVAGTASKNTQTNAYVSYDLGVAKLGLGYFMEKQDATGAAQTANTVVPAKLDSTAYNIGATVPLSANLSLLGSYTVKDDKTTLNLDRTVAAIGVKYTFSKMTSVYARYVSDKIDNMSATASKLSGKEVTTTLVGMQTNF